MYMRKYIINTLDKLIQLLEDLLHKVKHNNHSSKRTMLSLLYVGSPLVVSNGYRIKEVTIRSIHHLKHNNQLIVNGKYICYIDGNLKLHHIIS